MYKAIDITDTIARMISEGYSKPEIVKQAAEMCEGWPYVYAAAGEMCSPDWRKNRMVVSDEKYSKAIHDACQALNGSAGTCAGCKWQECRCFDCRGFTRWLLEQVGINLAGGGATTQWETKSNWAAQGTIGAGPSGDTLPKSLVCCVFKRKENKMSHTGMHIQGGRIIHCSTVVKWDTLPGKPAWTHWGIPAGLYTDEELKEAGVTVAHNANVPTLRRGSGGPAVEALQHLLNQWGAELEVDGVFGKKTETALRQFQQAHKLSADGIVGPKTRAVLDPLGMIDAAWSQKIEPQEAPDNAKTVWAMLLEAIGNPYAVAGIMGNLQAESGINPKNLNGAANKKLGMTDQEYTDGVDNGDYPVESFVNDGFAYGIAQWAYRTRKAALINYAASKRASIGDLNMQTAFMIRELQTYPALWKTLISAASVRQASDAVLTQYEKPSDQGEKAQEKRAACGQAFFERFADLDTAIETIPAPEEEAPQGTAPVPVTDTPQEDAMIISMTDFRAIKAALITAYAVIKQYEEG